MDRQEQRKRAFSQAFQRVNQLKLDDNNIKPAKRILSYPLSSTGHWHQDSYSKNEAPLNLDYAFPFEQIPATQIRHAPPIDLHFTDPVLYKNTSLQYNRYGGGPGPVLTADTAGMLPLVAYDRHFEGASLHEPALLTPHTVRGQSMLGPSPYVRPDSSLYLGDVNDFYANSPMSDVTTGAGPPTPSALNFGDLSLNNQGYSLPSSPLQHGSHGSRAAVRVVPTSSFASHFSHIHPSEVIILFDKGKEARKVGKYPLCSASRFFAESLDGPFLDHNLTRCIRLRDDLPYAITTMLHFIETGHYVFDQQAFMKYPLLTTLDFHVHVYLVSSKYGIHELQNYAIESYLNIADHEIKAGLLALSGSQLSDIQVSVPWLPAMVPADGYIDGDPVTMPVDRFANSLVLLWKNTATRYDNMRKAVLELIKSNLNKLLQVPFFVTLIQEMVGFGDDIVASLGDDGFDVKAIQRPGGARQIQPIRFDV